MVSVAGHIVEFNQSGFLLVECVNLQIVLVQNDVVGSVVSKYVRVHVLQQSLIAFVNEMSTSGQLVDLDVSLRSVDNQIALIDNPIIDPVHLQLNKIFSPQPLHHISRAFSIKLHVRVERAPTIDLPQP